MTEAYPLQWPAGWPSTPPEKRKRSAFQTTLASARDGVLHEIRLLKGKNTVISTNIPVRKDGMIKSRYSEPEDPAVAVYFTRNGKEVCVPCDKWTKVNDNLHAIELSINALRGLERWGAKTMVDAAFQGFEALPPHTDQPTSIPPKSYFQGCKTLKELKENFRLLSKTWHPDKGGDEKEFNELLNQYKRREKELREQ